MASEPTRERFKQRTDPQGVRLVRTGMEEGVVLADIANAIRHHDLTLSELRAILDEGHPPASPVPSVPTLDAAAQKVKAAMTLARTDALRMIQDDVSFLLDLAAEIDLNECTHSWRRDRDWLREIAERMSILGRPALRSEAEPSEDTARLDWLDDQTHLCQKPEFWMMGDEYSVEMCGECWTGKTLRAAIDSARSSSPEDPNGN